MKRFLACLLVLAACAGDETLTAYGAADKTWELVSINDVPFPADVSMRFPEAASLTGQAPCNRFSGSVTTPYPWFDTGPLVVTRMTCTDQGAEDMFLAAFDKMAFVEVTGNTLILSSEDGQEMLFKARD